MTDLPLGEILIPTLKHWYVYQLVYPLSIGLVKFSILAQYYRIFVTNRFRIAVIGVAAFVFAYTIIVIFVYVSCEFKPWRAWDPTSFPKGCNNLPAAYFSTAGINILTDLVILVMPLPLLMKLNLHRRRKYALIAIFLSGAFASAASIARLNALYKYTVTKDVSYDAIQILLWSQIEVNVAITSASAPSLRPMFNSIFKSSSYFESYGNYNHPSNNMYGAYSAPNHRRTLRPGTQGAIELSSRDDENYTVTTVGISGTHAPNGGQGSEERILAPKSNITKTIEVEMKSEQRK
ncbi:uncharacterized protein N7482_007787 [Penicillium canariense]|uniref:Rhodopsin domain-containing protein n=1 Tax=Penicillium canariense TaxID=189055 RepID=A0A9W9HZQ3_9EURO|nr:uncharacterized protein N7482_007787 [Penicillium canariense]KAJ5160783.1 hypothetical protein N7482_007787 [Penicillium canariense]